MSHLNDEIRRLQDEVQSNLARLNPIGKYIDRLNKQENAINNLNSINHDSNHNLNTFNELYNNDYTDDYLFNE